TLEMLQPASRTPLLLRQIPVWEDGVATGFVDLALERAFVYREAAPSSVIDTRKRLGIEDKGPSLAQVVRTIHTAHGGKLSLARVLRGAFADGATVVSSRGVEERIGGLARLMGAMSSKLTRA